MLDRTTIVVKKSGPSKHNPTKYGWILDETGKFWDVSLEWANASTPGSRWELAHHLNERGYTKVDSMVPLDDVKVDAKQTPPQVNGQEKGMIMKEAIALLLAGQSRAQAVETLLEANAIYSEFIGLRDGTSW